MLLFIRVPRLKETRWSFLLPFLTRRHCDSTIRFQDTDEGKITKAKYFRWLFLFFHHIFSLSTWCKWPGSKCEKGPMGFLGLLSIECDLFFLFFLYLEQILVHLEIIISLFYWEDIYLTDFRSTLAFRDCLNCLFNAVVQCCGNRMTRMWEHMNFLSPMFLSCACSLLQRFNSKLRPRKMAQLLITRTFREPVFSSQFS